MNGTDISSFFHIKGYQQVGSTNDILRELVEQGKGQEGLIVWAEQQTAGRGRRGRNWFSPPGNLYMSLLLSRPHSLAEAALVGLVAAVSLAVGIKGFVAKPDEVKIKWPNDLLIEQKKCAGILLETIEGRGRDQQDYIIVGIGVNIRHHPEGLPYPATSLTDHALSKKIGPLAVLEEFCKAFLPRLHHWRNGKFSEVRREWLNYAIGLGQKITVHMPGKTVEGIFEDIDQQGQLLLRQEQQIQKITVGDVFFATEGA